MRAQFVILLLASILILGTFATGTIAFANFDQCANDPEQGKNKGTPFLEIWAAICDLQNQIDNLELSGGPKGDKGDTGEQGPQGIQGEPGPAGTGGSALSCENQEAIAVIVFDFVIDDECFPVGDDLDNDGYFTDGSGLGLDCDDSDPAINPGAAEIPGNSIDDNCNGEVDEGSSWDVVFLFDITGSMSSEIGAFRASFPVLLDIIDTSSVGDYRIGFVTFGDGVTVLTPLTSDIDTINSVVASLTTSEGQLGEASNEAKNTVINNLLAGQRDDILGNTGTQTGNFDVLWNSDAIKIAILLTDEGPSGFDSIVDLADVIQMELLGGDAGALGIKFSDINTGTDNSVTDALFQDAFLSGGLLRVATDAQVVTAIQDILLQKGGPGVAPPPSSPVFAWGNGRQLGDGTDTNSLTPVLVSGLTNVLDISAGLAHSLTLLNDNTVVAWGTNGAGQLGDGTTTVRLEPVSVVGLTNVIEVSAGYRHSLALSDGMVFAWGKNNQGQLGDGTITDSLTPIPVPGLTNVIAISGGEDHSLALSGGTVFAWGANGQGELGDGTATDSLTPVLVSGLTNVIDISAGESHSLALLIDGTVVAWGSNNEGQLGDGTATDSLIPIPISGLTDVIAISAGETHSLALLNGGTVIAWGSAEQLGNIIPDEFPLIQVNELTDAIAISAGVSHSLAVRSDGTVVAWGLNTNGQLGDGTTIDRLTPVSVVDITDITDVSAGNRHSLAK